jgi:hypothetical protein
MAVRKKKPTTLGKRLAKLESDEQVNSDTMSVLCKEVENVASKVDSLCTRIGIIELNMAPKPKITETPISIDLVKAIGRAKEQVFGSQIQSEGRVSRVGSEEIRREFEYANTLLLHIDRHISTLRQERRSLYDKWTEGKVTQEELDAFGLKIREECVKRRKIWRNGTHFFGVHESMRAKLESNKRINNSAKIEQRVTREKRRAEIGVIVGNNDNHFSRNAFYKEMVINADQMEGLTNGMLRHLEHANNTAIPLYLELCSHHQRITSVDIA